MTPILSICIPTLNRAHLLKSMLFQLARVVEGYLDRVEIVIADNASIDETKKVVESCPLPIQYGCQKETVGFTKNVLFATTELARGEFIWIVGDDDLIVPSALKHIFDSLARTPDVSYHYLNFGWINIAKRDEIIYGQSGYPNETQLKKLQFNETSWRLLDKIESLTQLPSDNISASFSGIFCFICRRQLFINEQITLNPTDSLDGSSTNMSDCFPHAMLTLAPLAGKPIAFVGEPCLLQGINGWEWGGYAYKNMILGTYQLFSWLQSTAFDQNALEILWKSYYSMAGRLFARMQHEPDQHKGAELILKEAIPHSTSHPQFWDSLMTEMKMLINIDNDVEALANWLRQELTHNPQAKLGLWGVAGRGTKLFRKHPNFLRNLIWITDKNELEHGLPFLQSGQSISQPESQSGMDIDILLIGTRSEFVIDVENHVCSINPLLITISVNGIKRHKHNNTAIHKASETEYNEPQKN